MQFTTHTAGETEALAKELLPQILNKKIIQLSGNLGSGKTTFVKGLAKALGIPQPIKSPTYTYQNKYPLRTPNSELRTTLYHFDLYRLPETSEHPDQVKASIGLEDALNDEKSIVIIEWPERLPLKIPSLRLHFKKLENSHQINITQQ